MSLVEPVIAFSVAVVLTLVAILATLLLAMAINKGLEHPLKRCRYEAGNPPRGHARIVVPPQYYGYVLMFLVVDVVFVFLFLLSLASKLSPFWVLITILVLLPPLMYAQRYARDIKQWT